MTNTRELFFAARAAAEAIHQKADDEKRERTPDERKQMHDFIEEANTHKAQMKIEESDAALRKAILDLGAGVPLGDAPQTRQDPVRSGKVLTVGDQFNNDASWRAWYKASAPNGQIPDSARGFRSPPVEFKDLITGANVFSAGAFVNPDITGIYDPLGRRQLTALGLVNRRSTTSDVVEYVRQTKKVTEAAAVAEANVKIYTGATGEISGEKPQGAMYFEKVY